MKQPNKLNSQLQQEILGSFQQLVKALIKTLLEALMLEEREIYLEETEDYANGFYSRDLLTALGEVKGLRVPRVRKGSFRPVILPERKKAGLDLTEVVISLYASGVSTRKISKVLENIYGAYYSPQSISRLIKVTEEEIKAWKERALSEEYFAVFWMGLYYPFVVMEWRRSQYI
jgi:transposase-like protein